MCGTCQSTTKSGWTRTLAGRSARGVATRKHSQRGVSDGSRVPYHQVPRQPTTPPPHHPRHPRHPHHPHRSPPIPTTPTTPHPVALFAARGEGGANIGPAAKFAGFEYFYRLTESRLALSKVLRDPTLGLWLGGILAGLPYYFLLLPRSPSVSCPCVDALHTLHDTNFRRLLPSPTVSQRLQPVQVTHRLLPNYDPQALGSARSLSPVRSSSWACHARARPCSTAFSPSTPTLARPYSRSSCAPRAGKFVVIKLTVPRAPADSAGSTSPIGPTEPTGPANPTDPTNPTNSTNPTNPTDPANFSTPSDDAQRQKHSKIQIFKMNTLLPHLQVKFIQTYVTTKSKCLCPLRGSHLSAHTLHPTPRTRRSTASHPTTPRSATTPWPSTAQSTGPTTGR